MSTADAILPVSPAEYVELHFGNKTFRLRYNFKAFIYIEKQTGRSIAQLGNFATMSAKDLRSIVTAGITDEHNNKVSPFEVGSMLWLGNVAYVMRKVTEALTKSLVKSVPKEEAAPLDPTKK